jgi:hypothetical protein
MVGAAGCATTGLAWVHEAESGVDLSPPVQGATPMAPVPWSPVLAEGLQDAPAPRRIDRTITLGETTGVTGTNGEAVDQRSNPSPVVINIYVASPPPAGYGPVYGVAAGDTRFGGSVRPQAGRAVALRPGLDWAPPPSYGPAFPYRMAPSSPWNGDGSDRTRGK